MTREEAIATSWEAGVLRHLLDATQRRMYDAVKAFKARPDSGKFFYLNCARQLGKSYLLAVLALEDCLRIRGGRVKYPAPTQKMARAIVRPQLFKLLEGCPQHLRPTYSSQDGEWRFPKTGAVLTLFGCDGDNFQRGRGQSAHSIYPDEFGFMDRAKDVLFDVLVPQLQTTGGKVVVASSPSDTVDHFSTELARECEARGTYLKLTAHDNVRVPKDELEAICMEYGGPTATRWRREYLCEFVTDTSSAVFPSWNEERAALAIGEWERPKFFDTYVSVDLGYADGTGVLFGYYDYDNACIVIEDEWLERRQNTDQIMQAIVAREQELWGLQRPYLRVYDAGAGGDRFAADFSMMHGFDMSPADKSGSLHAAVNRVDVWIAHSRLHIHSRCKQLIQQLYGASWDKPRKKFKRTERGHYDLAAALVYFVRHVNEAKNPFVPERPDISNTWVNQDAFGPDDSSMESAFRMELG